MFVPFSIIILFNVTIPNNTSHVEMINFSNHLGKPLEYWSQYPLDVSIVIEKNKNTVWFELYADNTTLNTISFTKVQQIEDRINLGFFWWGINWSLRYAFGNI